MARLPTPGGDSGNWGHILNDYLLQSHTTTGEIKPGAITKADIGLGNVDNTSDANKPVSSAAQTALDSKLDEADLDASVATKLADNASQTRTAIDALINGANTGLDTIVQATLDAGDTYTLDPTTADQFILTLTGNATLVIPSYSVGSRFLVQIMQDGAGGHTLTLPDAAGYVALDTTALTYELLVYRCWTAERLDVSQVTQNTPVEAPFTPALLASQIVWFNANAIAGDDGDAITRWSNSFTNGEIDLGQSTSANRPTLKVINGVNVVDFVPNQRLEGVNPTNGSSSAWINGTYPQPATIALLVRKTGGTSTQPVLAGNGDASKDWNVYVDSSTGKWATNATNDATKLVEASSTAVSNQWETIVVLLNGATSKIRVSGNETAGQAGTVVSSGIRMGMNTNSSSYANVQVAEVFYLAHLADNDEITSIETYLNKKKTKLAGS
jgi:hypothetical protein